MSIFSKLFRREADKKSEQSFISSFRYRGRWYGLMICLGEESGRDMKEKMKDKGSEILTMLEIINEFPEDFKYVNQLLALEKQYEEQSKQLSGDEQQRDYARGAIEAKKVYLDGKDWKRLLMPKDI